MLPTPSAQRLMKLLTMMPAPHEEVFPHFWRQVAEELPVDYDYVIGKIAVHFQLILAADHEDPELEKDLAKYALFFFGESSEDLIDSIADEVDPGTPNAAAGRAWIKELRSAAFAVFETNQSPDETAESNYAWAKHSTRHRGDP